MKYLRGIFESIVPEFMEELKDFCESNLIYLIDDGFTLEFIDTTEYYRAYKKDFRGISVRLSKYSSGRNNLIGDCKQFSYFNWNDIKDYYIPFLVRVSNEYKIFDKCLISLEYGGAQLVSYDDLVKDRIDLDKSIKSISIKVGDKL